MFGFIFAVVYTWAIKILHVRFKFSKERLAKFETVKHHGTIISEGLEFHFFVTFIFPLTHGYMEVASHTAHIEWLMALYH